MTQTYALRKTAFRSLALLGVLGVCTALAAWVSHHKSAPMNTAINVLTEIRSEGLDTLWADKPETTYTIYRKGQQHVGYLIQQRQRDSEGHFHGQDRRRIQVKSYQAQSTSRWTLNPSATEGDYQAESVATAVTPKGPRREITRMKMQLAGQRLTIARSGLAQPAGANVPDNYVPEGLLSAVQRRVAMQESPARFAVIFDRYAISPQGQVQFADMTLEPMGIEKGVRRLKLTDSVSGLAGERIVEFDGKTGMLLQIVHADGMIEEVVPREEFILAYPQTNP
jgi:hypothetical protein